MHRRVDMGGPPEFNPKVTPDAEQAERLAERLRMAMERLKQQKLLQRAAMPVPPVPENVSQSAAKSFARVMIATAMKRRGETRPPLDSKH